MPEQPANLRPYGSLAEPAAFIDKAAVARRARDKLAAARRRGAEALDPSMARQGAPGSAWYSGSAVVVIPALLVLLATLFIPFVGVIFFYGFVGVMFVALGRARLRRVAVSAHESPDAAVRSLLSLALARPKWAWAMLLPEDRDEMPRSMPTWKADGAAPHARAVFSDPHSFADYWKALSGGYATRYVTAESTTLKVHRLAEDMALVAAEFGLRARNATALKVAAGIFLAAPVVLGAIGAFAFLVAGHKIQGPEVAFVVLAGLAAMGLSGIYFLLGMMSQPIGTARVQKLAIRVHDRWQTFNGELMGPEESDLSWLEQVGIAPPPPGVSN